MLGLTLAIGAAVVAALVIALLSSYGRLARRAVGEPSHALPVREGETALDRAVAALPGERRDATGLLLLADNLDAFALRAATARQAGRSLDLQYYYWRGDLTGTLLAREVLAAADRGVRVRLLIDDISLRGGDPVYRAVDSHPHIEVRLFNPSRNRSNGIKRGIELLARFVTATRRMHNKAWIADGRVAIIGGRNIGDAYFDAAKDANFHDMDLALVGAALAPAQAVFDEYWNSAAAVPIAALSRRRAKPLDWIRSRHTERAASKVAAPYLARAAAAENGFLSGRALRWVEGVEVVADCAEKALGCDDSNRVAERVARAVGGAASELAIISPYFIPGTEGVAELGRLRARGVRVAVLTNSLAATDVVAVHGAYARYRKRLLALGVALFELRSERVRARASLFGSKTASLHTKAFVVDRNCVFIGSFNFDPRSASLNTEMGVIAHDGALAAQVRGHFERQTAGDASYRVTLDDGRLVWLGEAEAEAASGAEPTAGPWRRLAAAAIGFLPIESQL